MAISPPFPVRACKGLDKRGMVWGCISSFLCFLFFPGEPNRRVMGYMGFCGFVTAIIYAQGRERKRRERGVEEVGLVVRRTVRLFLRDWFVRLFDERVQAFDSLKSRPTSNPWTTTVHPDQKVEHREGSPKNKARKTEGEITPPIFTLRLEFFSAMRLINPNR